MKKISYTRPDGGLSIVHPVINKGEAITEDEALARALERLPADAIGAQIIEASDIPADRTFRNAWAQNGKIIAHDMVKAREIQRERLRRVREPLQAELDAIDRASTVDDLKLITVPEARNNRARV